MAKTKRRPLTEEEKACADRLANLFLAKKERDGTSQAALGDAVGISQSAVQQYLSGGIPLNLKKKFEFAKALGCSVGDIDPELTGLAYLEDREKRLITGFRSLSPPLQDLIEAAIKGQDPQGPSQ